VREQDPLGSLSKVTEKFQHRDTRW